MKKLFSILIAVVMVLTIFSVQAFAQDSYAGDFSVDVTSGEQNVIIDWEDFAYANCYKITIDTEIEYYCEEGVVTQSCYEWYPDYNVTPNEIFDITVYAYDNAGKLIAQSDTVQLYIVTQFCDYFGYYGDIDGDQTPSVIDATYLQNYLARATDFNAMQVQLADVDGDSVVSVMDSTFIQQFCAAIYSPKNRTNESFALGWVEYNVNFDKWWEA